MFKIYYVLTFPLALIELALIWVYRHLIRYALNKSCKFFPTCSKYTWDCILSFGAIWGLVLAIKRIVKCKPNKPSGIDFVKLNILGNYKWKC